MTSVLSIYGESSGESHGWLASKVIHKVKSKGRVYMAKRAFKYISQILTTVEMVPYEQAFYAKAFALPIPQNKLLLLKPNEFQSYWDSGYISLLDKPEAAEVLKAHGTKDMFSRKERKAFLKSIEYGAGNSLAVCINAIYNNLSDDIWEDDEMEVIESDVEEEEAAAKPEESAEPQETEAEPKKTETATEEPAAEKKEEDPLDNAIASSNTFFFNILSLYYMSQVYYANKDNAAGKDYVEAFKENVVVAPETEVYDFKGNNVTLKELGRYRSHRSEYQMLPLAEEGSPIGYKIGGVLRSPQELWKYITVEQAPL